MWSAYEAGASCLAPQELDWLQVEPMAGTVAPGAMVELMLHIDMQGLPEGDYLGTLCLLDSAGDTQALPLHITVNEAMSLRLFLPMMRR